MPPKNSKERLIAALEANLPIQYAPRSIIPRIGGIALTDRLGNTKPIGRTYLNLAEQYGRTRNLDPFVYGTYTRGQSEYARTVSGKEVRVAYYRSGQLVPTKNGELYFGPFAEQYNLWVPTIRVIKNKDLRGRFDGTATEIRESTPISSLTLKGTNALKETPAAGRMRELPFVRDRNNNPLTTEQKWTGLLQAFARYIKRERNSPDAE